MIALIKRRPVVDAPRWRRVAVVEFNLGILLLLGAMTAAHALAHAPGALPNGLVMLGMTMLAWTEPDPEA